MCVKNLKASVLSFVSLPCSCWCYVVKFKYSYSVLRDKGLYKGDTSSLHVNLNKQFVVVACCSADNDWNDNCYLINIKYFWGELTKIIGGIGSWKTFSSLSQGLVRKKQSCYLQLGSLFARFSRPMDHATFVTRNVLCNGGRLVVLLSIRTFWSVHKNLFGWL